MSTTTRLKVQIASQTNIEKLVFLRDYGLDMILDDPDVTDFTIADKEEVLTAIEAQIALLQNP